MTASYPGSVRVFTTKSNVTDTVDASHPNSLQEEVVAIETVLGTAPNVSTTPSNIGTFNPSSTAYVNVSARLANIETGIVADSHTQYVRKSGDGSNVIVTSAGNNKGLTIKGALGQSANLQDWQDSTGTVLASVTPDGRYTGKVYAQDIVGSVTSIPADLSIVQKAVDYTVGITDKNGFIWCVNTAAGITITVPNNATTPFAVGTQINVLKGMAGAVSFAAQGPAQIYGTPGLKLRTMFSSATLVKLSENYWVVIGDLSA
jgi:hypothetical protein